MFVQSSLYWFSVTMLMQYQHDEAVCRDTISVHLLAQLQFVGATPIHGCYINILVHTDLRCLAMYVM